MTKDDMQQQIIVEPTIIIEDDGAGLLEWSALVIVPLILGYLAWHRAHKDKDDG